MVAVVISEDGRALRAERRGVLVGERVEAQMACRIFELGSRSVALGGQLHIGWNILQNWLSCRWCGRRRSLMVVCVFSGVC